MATLKQQLPQIRDAINAALEAAGIAKQFNLKSIVAGNCSFDPDAGAFTFKVDGVEADGIGKEGALYNQLRLGEPSLPPLFSVIPGTDDYIVGCNSSGTKIFTKRNEKRYQWPLLAVRRRFGVVDGPSLPEQRAMGVSS